MPIVEAIATAKGSKRCPNCGHSLRESAPPRWACANCGSVYMDFGFGKGLEKQASKQELKQNER